MPGQIGAFRPVRLLGVGGMGRVYLAEQLAPVQRRVALKVMSGGRSNSVARAYFEIERQVLAQMQHPAIAQIHDAGTSEDGQPWFAMEWVPGTPITAHAESFKLPRAERLALFIRVCLGVHHAHQRGIIHRDLKPSNILVSRVDGVSVPKIIDFGIAIGAAADSDIPDAGSSARAGTRAYMSPEQLSKESARIDVRSDVYSLGVVLFELLTAVRFPDTDGESEVKELRSVLERGRGSLTSVTTVDGADHGESVRPLVSAGRNIPFELRCILARALAPDPAQRYQTAEAMAADVGAFQAGNPVSAVPTSRTYRWRKALWRHRVGVAVAGLVSLSLIVGLAVALWGLVQANAERDRAQVEADRAERSLGFLTSMLSSIDPDYAEGEDTALMRRVLSDAADQAERTLHDQPDIEWEIQQVVGQSYAAIGEHDLAREHIERARTLARRTGRIEHELAAGAALANLEASKGNHDEALAQAGAVLAVAETVLPPGHRIVLDLQVTQAHAHVFSGRPQEAELVIRPVLEHTAHAAEDPALLPLRLQAMRALGTAYLETRGYEESQAVYQEVQREAEAWGTPQGIRQLGMALNDEAVVLLRQQRYAEAEALLRRSLEVNEPRLGSNHPSLIASISNLASSLRQQGKLEESRPYFERALRIARQRLGEVSMQAVTVSYNLGNLHRELGEADEAVRLQRWVLEVAPDVFPETHPGLGMFRLGLGRSELAAGNSDTAARLLAEAVPMLRDYYGPSFHRTIEAAEHLALALDALDRSDEAAHWRGQAAEWADEGSPEP